MQSWQAKRVLIIGAARQGLALARYLALHGARVTLNDRRPAEDLQTARQALSELADLHWVTGGHPMELLEETDLICVSGGVPLDLPLLAEARRRDIPFSNDSQIFLTAAPCPVVGITGSAGKTTTTTLVGRMAYAATKDDPARRSWVGGNIGSPLVAVVDEMGPQDLAIMELSSFQLELMTVSPQVAAVLNITPNHLDRHGTMEAYTAAKARILEFQSAEDAAVLNRDDPGSWGLAAWVRGRRLSFSQQPLPAGQEGTYLDGEGLYLQTIPADSGPTSERLMDLKDVLLRGEHNVLNVLAACAIAAAAGLPVKAMRAGVAGFNGVPHRLEFVRSWGGADWYNDSIATAPERAIAAILSFEEPLVLLAGGRDKDLPWEDFAHLVIRHVDHLILFGEAAGLVEQAVEEAAQSANMTGNLDLIHCENLKEAVQAAARVVEPGDIVLLSPGGTSFDEFSDFEERGRCFVHWVKELP